MKNSPEVELDAILIEGMKDEADAILMQNIKRAELMRATPQELARRVIERHKNRERTQDQWEQDIAQAITDFAAPLRFQLRNMIREWEAIIGTSEENRTPGDTLENAKKALRDSQ